MKKSYIKFIFKRKKNKKSNKLFIIAFIFTLYAFTNFELKIIYLKAKIDRLLIFSNAKMFIEKCFNQHPISNKFQFDNTPVISVIIPLYNCEKTINASIASIQYQNLTDFEIILINDYSYDNTFNIIKSFEKYDQRIKIINNKKNMGSLYSRSIGILISKGEYIFSLDNDDLFFSSYVFDSILKCAKDSDFDIIGFKAISINDYKDNIEQMKDLYNYEKYPKNLVVSQPKLSKWIFTKNGHFSTHDVTIWAKCIKSNIYKRAILQLGKKRYSIFVSWAEDTIINVVIFSIASLFKFVHIYGIIHLINNLTASFTQSSNIKLFGELYLLDIIFDFSRNTSDKNFAVEYAINIKNTFRIKEFKHDINLIYFQSILKKFLKSLYITKRNKEKIKKDFETFFI